MKYILPILFLLGVSCSDGFKQSSLPAFSVSPNKPFQFPDQDFQLAIETGPYQGRLVVDQIRNSSIKILVPIGINNSVPTGSFSADQWSLVGFVNQDQNFYKTLEMLVPITHITLGVSAPRVTTLPTGEALNFIGSGDAQHFSFPLNSANTVVVHVYLSPPNLIGVFIQTPFDLGTAARYSVAPVSSLVSMGFFSTHPRTSNVDGGPFVFISLPQ